MPNVRTFSIGALAEASGVKLETVRYYERVGLMPAPPRTDGGHRLYEAAHLKRLRFIRRARELGFGIEAIRTLLALSDDSPAPCEAVEAIARAHLQTVRAKIADLQRLEALLAATLTRCGTSPAPACAVLEILDDA